MQQEFHSIDDPDKKIPKDERDKGYKYGKSIVKFSAADEEALAYKVDESCMRLIGFCPSKQVPSK